MLPQLKRGGLQNTQARTVPAAIRGINAIVSIAEMGADEAIFMSNILPEDFGCEVRDGFSEWANGWTGGPAKTVMPFEGNVNADDKLFVASQEGIFDVTVEGTTAPVQVVVFPSSANQAGICHSVNYGNDDGNRFLLVVDGENGYYVWTQTTDTWDKIVEGGAGITGVDPALFNFVMIWKARVWFIQRETGLAWYLPVEAFLGAVKKFNFSDQFRFGGPLVSLHNWTLDGGNGIDDYLVGISGAGDVIVYQGVDVVDKADFGLVGSWYVGELPFGNRVASEFSGELYVLSVQGLLPMSQILNGSTETDPKTYVTNKVSPYIRSVMDASQNDFGWHIHVHPKQSLLFINTPTRPASQALAFTLYFGHMSWAMISGLNKNHTANWRGEVYWVDGDRNKIFKQGGFVDNVYIDPVLDGDPTAIDWEVLGSYEALGTPNYKRMQYIRPMFVGQGGQPSFVVKAYYDFDISRLSQPPVYTQGINGIWGNSGRYTFTLQSEGADLLVMSVQDGKIQLSGVDTIDITIGTHPLATVTWNPTNSRYEGASVGIQAYLVSQIGNNLATIIDPDIIASSNYTLVPAALGADAGFNQPLFDILNDPLPPATILGSLRPSVIFGTGTPVAGEGSWNADLWSGGISTSDNPVGANGMGRHVAVNIRGRTSNATTLVAFDVLWDEGGYM